MSGEFEIGISKVDITGPVAGQNFMGYVHTPQVGSGLNDRLYCRAFFLKLSHTKEDSDNLIIVHTDLMSISIRLRQRIVSRLEEKYPNLVKAQNIVIHSQHTHSAPGGLHPDYVYYFASLGFALNHFDFMTERITQCVEEAIDSQNLFRGDVFLSKTRLFKVGRNRSPEAFQNNPRELIEEFLSLNTENKRTTMTVLRIEDSETKLTRGIMSFFPIHTTSFNREAHMVSADNKGFAEYLIESQYKGVIAAFFQTEAGDVSPNMEDDVSSSAKHSLFKHAHEDYIESCEAAGRQQAGGVLQALKGELSERKLEAKLGGRLIYVNYDRECPGVGGLSALDGTEDGRGVLCVVEGLNETELAKSYSMQLCSKASRYLSRVVLTLPFLGRGQSYEFVGPRRPMKLRGERYADFVTNSLLKFDVDLFRESDRSVDCQRPKITATDSDFVDGFMPGILPLQVLKLGNLVLPSMPFEITSMAGHLFRKALKESNPDIDVELLAISNGYAQYISTEKEFDAQHYEGASTLFGRKQLEITIRHLKKLQQSLELNENYGTLSEKEEFLKEIDRSQEQEFDDGQTSFVFDEVMHSAISHVEISPKPFYASFFAVGAVLKDVPLKELDLLDKSPLQRRKVTASFSCVFPGNSQKLISSFCDVETETGSTFLRDNDWNVRFVYRKKYLFMHSCTCEWLVHNTKEHFDIPNQRYRLRFNGVYEDSGELQYFTDASSYFKVTNGGPSIAFSEVGRLSGERLVREYQNYMRDEMLLVITIVLLVIARCCYRCCGSVQK